LWVPRIFFQWFCLILGHRLILWDADPILKNTCFSLKSPKKMQKELKNSLISKIQKNMLCFHAYEQSLKFSCLFSYAKKIKSLWLSIRIWPKFQIKTFLFPFRIVKFWLDKIRISLLKRTFLKPWMNYFEL